MKDRLVVRATDEESRRLGDRIKEKAPDFRCQACGHRDFAVLEQPSAKLRHWLVREEHAHAAIGNKMVQRLVTIVCTNCGHLEQFAEAALVGADPGAYGTDEAA
jgi:DNA-directed RNA polymerase subunit RPC12/RpoP